MYTFITRRGVQKTGKLVRHYMAFEGEERFIFLCEGIEYRCVKDENGNFVEK